MKAIASLFIILLASVTSSQAQKPVKVTFKALDSLAITADVYEKDPGFPVVLLCHQARFSRGEYKETAIKLNELGYNCVAIDQRSGAEANGIANETAKLAKMKKLPVEYLDAKADMVAALMYCSERWKSQVILVGSSYSASLALEIGRQVDGVRAVVAFSPGEYFGEHPVYKNANGISIPCFITCSQAEIPDTKKFVGTLNATQVTFFAPEGEGDHGSKVLWEEKPDHAEYWSALIAFLNSLP